MKLNLGCGENRKAGYYNVDKQGSPDVLHDLETFPWPWDDESIDEVLMNHVLEHLGESVSVYLSIIKELYRICKPGAIIHIFVPHPRHDNFISDPTHVRAVTPFGLSLFNQAQNRKHAKKGAANSPLGLYCGVDFKVDDVKYSLEDEYAKHLNADTMSIDDLNRDIKRYNNVVKEMHIIWRRI